jgi:hypothetical protein
MDRLVKKAVVPTGRSSSLIRKSPSGPSNTLSGNFSRTSCAIGPTNFGSVLTTFP